MSDDERDLPEWKQAIDNVFGVWRDRPEIEEFYKALRDDLKRRHSFLDRTERE
jgi:hypothetical protein